MEREHRQAGEGRPSRGEIVRLAIRSAAASFPGAASLGVAWSEWDVSAKIRKIECLVRSFAEEVENLGGALHAHLRSHEVVGAVLERAVRSAEVEPDPAKREEMGRVAARLVVEDPDEDLSDKLNVLEALDRLDMHDLAFLRSFPRDSLRQLPPQGDVEEMGRNLVSVSKLIARGLVIERTKDTKSLGVWERAEVARVQLMGRTFMLLPFGRRVRELLDDAQETG